MNRRQRRQHTKKRGDLNRKSQHEMRTAMGEGSKVETRNKIYEKLGIKEEEHATTHEAGSQGLSDQQH